MKNLTIVLTIAMLLSLFPSGVIAQDKKDEKPKQSKLEEFSSRSGQLIQKKFITIGKFKDITIKTLTLTDVMSKKSLAGVRFERTNYIGSTSRTEICFLDEDEVDATVKSLKYLKSDVINNPAETYTEYQFDSRSDFQIGCFSSAKNWVGFVRISRYGDGLVSFNVSDFDSLITMLEDAKTKLAIK